MSTFGPLELTSYDDSPDDEVTPEEAKRRSELATKEKKAIQDGYNRVLSRIKKIRIKFSETMSSSLSSGSAK